MNKTELCIGVASAQLRIFGSSVRPLFEVRSYQSLRHSAACDTFAKLLAIEERVGVQDGNHCKPCTLISSQSFHKVFVGGTAYHRYSDISLISVHTIDTAIHEDSSSKKNIYIYICAQKIYSIFFLKSCRNLLQHLGPRSRLRSLLQKKKTSAQN